VTAACLKSNLSFNALNNSLLAINIILLKMNEQDESLNTDPLRLQMEGFGTRLAQVVAAAGISQTEFARRVGASPGFISDMIRGLKKPGSDFLYRLRHIYGTSLDWLLTGEGSPQGKSGIDLDLLRIIRLQLALVRAAVLNDDPTAKAILLLIRNSRLTDVQADSTLNQFIETLPIEDIELALELYNGHIAIADPLEQHRSLLASAVAHFETRKPFDKLRSLGRASGAAIQINLGTSQRNAGGDYHEHK